MAPTTNNNTTTVRAHEHDTLDALCHRHLGRTAGTVEATLAATPQRAMRPPPLPPASCVAFDGADESEQEQRPQALQWDFGE